MDTSRQQAETRRTFLAKSPLAGAALFAGELGAPRRIAAQTRLSPNAALQELLEGNKRYVNHRSTAHYEDLSALRQSTAEKQEPIASVLACADSRVPVEIIFDQSIGRIFVTRIAGNIVTPEIIASLEYGAAVLGTKAIVVMGHANCGAVEAAIEGKPVPGQISNLYLRLRPAVDQAGTDTDAAIKANARIQFDMLREASTVVSGLVSERKLRVVAAYYDLAHGQVTLLESAG